MLGLLIGVCSLLNGVVSVEDREVRVRHLVDLHCVAEPLRRPLGDLVVSRRPVGVADWTMAAEVVADLVRRRVPELPIGRPSGSLTLHFAREAAIAPELPCWETTRAIPRGAVVEAAALVVREKCSHESSSGGVLLVGQVLRARVDLAEGAVLGRVWLPPAPAIDAGAELQLTAKVGMVRVERKVRALEPIWLRQVHAFVLGEDGAVLSATVADLQAGVSP